MADFEFRVLNSLEAERAYQILEETVVWLREKNIQLWEKPLPHEVYFARQSRGENFGLFVEGEMAVIVSLTDIPSYWSDRVNESSARWLSTVATANRFRGQNWGRRAVEMACGWLAGQGKTAVYLDCKPEFLEQFYTDLGFQAQEKRQIALNHFSPCVCVEAVLMRKSIDLRK